MLSNRQQQQTRIYGNQSLPFFQENQQYFNQQNMYSYDNLHSHQQNDNQGMFKPPGQQVQPSPNFRRLVDLSNNNHSFIAPQEDKPLTSQNVHQVNRSVSLEQPLFEAQTQAEEGRTQNLYTANPGTQQKRHLPIKTRESSSDIFIGLEIFNEWAAVLKHQDEIDEQSKQEDLNKLRMRQQMYKNELDNQIHNLKQKQQEGRSQDKRADSSMLNYLKNKDSQQQSIEEQKREMLRRMIQTNVEASLQEKNRLQHEQKEKSRQEQDNARNLILMQQEKDRKAKQDEIAERQKVQTSYYQDLAAQERFKRMQEAKLKQEDQIFSKIEENQSAKVEENRQLYFNNLKRYQENNDKKLDALSNYLGGADIKTLAKKDEIRYLNAVKEREEKTQKKEEEEQRRNVQTKHMNMQGLNHQMMEKDMSKKMRRIEDNRYAENVKNSVWEAQQADEQVRTRAKNRQMEYLASLNKQMEEARVKKKFDSLMTEHERRVNDRDIKAYEVADTRNLYGKLPGNRGHEQERQEMYLNKLFTQQHSLNASMNPTSRQAYLNASPMTRIQSKQKSQLVLGAENQIRNVNNSMDMKTIEEVRRNMEMPEALKYRHNTGNKLYGFDQILSKQQHSYLTDCRVGNGGANPEEFQTTDYKFAVVGNYKN